MIVPPPQDGSLNRQGACGGEAGGAAPGKSSCSAPIKNCDLMAISADDEFWWALTAPKPAPG